GRTAAISFLLIGGASLAMWLIPSVPVYVISFAILWGSLGGWLAVAPTATARYFGTSDPRMYGVVFLAYGAGALVGPQLAGFIRTATGSWIGVFPYVAAMAVVGFVIAVTVLRKE
ncbi:MAG: OFA family MFS transporter, partial [Methanomicrobiales archaeon]|nr:OFA family MFS transporter [Methanomicrobiales archaeon]